MAKSRIPSINADEFASLNDRFYRIHPYRYFELRLRSLLVSVSDDVDTNGPFRNGVSFEDLRIGGGPGDEDPTAADISSYAAMESVVLLHHACETMLRLYFAHSNRNACPWVAMSALRDFRAFKARLSDLRLSLNDPDVVSDLLEVFAYSNKPVALNGPNLDGIWAAHTAGVVRLVEYALEVLLDDANVYNSAKHGMALLAGPVGVTLGNPETLVIGAHGPAIVYLETKSTAGVTEWQVTTQWVDPVLNMTMTALVTHQIESLWIVARAHYGLEPLREFVLLDGEKVDAAIHVHDVEGFNVTRMTEQLQPE